MLVVPLLVLVVADPFNVLLFCVGVVVLEFRLLPLMCEFVLLLLLDIEPLVPGVVDVGFVFTFVDPMLELLVCIPGVLEVPFALVVEFVLLFVVVLFLLSWATTR